MIKVEEMKLLKKCDFFLEFKEQWGSIWNRVLDWEFEGWSLS